MANNKILTNTDQSVDTNFPTVTGTTSGASKHLLDVAVYDASGNQITSFGGGGGGGSTTQYTEGDTDDTITGTAMLMEGAGHTLLPVQGTIADGLLVNLGSNNDVTVTSSALPTGAATSANQSTIIGHIDGIETLLTTIDADTGTLAGAVAGSEMQVDIVSAPTLTVQATNLGIRDLVFASDKVDASGSTLGANSGVDIGDVTINNGSGASAVNIQDGGNSITVDGTVTINEPKASTASHTNVSASASNVTLLSSNANRLGATIYNDSTAVLYVKLGATASTTSFVTKLYQDDYYEVPFNYTGIIDGIWASATGAARIVEFT